jgi:hypothetical protein
MDQVLEKLSIGGIQERLIQRILIGKFLSYQTITWNSVEPTNCPSCSRKIMFDLWYGCKRAACTRHYACNVMYWLRFYFSVLIIWFCRPTFSQELQPSTPSRYVHEVHSQVQRKSLGTLILFVRLIILLLNSFTLSFDSSLLQEWTNESFTLLKISPLRWVCISRGGVTLYYMPRSNFLVMSLAVWFPACPLHQIFPIFLWE